MVSTEDVPHPVKTDDPALIPQVEEEKEIIDVTPPTDSHLLAQDEETLIHQSDHPSDEVRDLGWGEESPYNVPERLIKDLSNEEIWTLVRRFNKQIYDVKKIDTPPMANLDLNISNDELYSPDKLRASLERLYMTVIVGVVSGLKHIARIRSWNEKRRTIAFMIGYFAVWFLDLMVPSSLLFILVLVLFPQVRPVLFPPAPLALIDAKTGGLKRPSAGHLGSESLTGAAEKHEGEAVEQEAHNFVNVLGAIGLSSVTGKHPATQGEEDNTKGTIPEPTETVMVIADSKKAAEGGETNAATHDKTKQPMEASMWAQVKPIMRIIGDISDAWERLGNALSPVSPFPQWLPRLKLGAVLFPLIIVTALTTPYMVVKGTQFIIGVVFFSGPLLLKGAELMQHYFPDWQKYLDLRNGLLRGVPTNAQLTITLLRIGENNKAPLPPPPTSSIEPSVEKPELHADDLPLEVTNSELQDKLDPPETEVAEGSAEEPKKKSGFVSKLGSLAKGTVKVGVLSTFKADQLKAASGSHHSKKRLGVIPTPNDLHKTGPIDFTGRLNGKKGVIYLNTSATVPCVSFTFKSKVDNENMSSLDPVWSVPIIEIVELKKVGGLGWKSKLLVSWSTGREVEDGMIIVDKHGKSHSLTAIQLRDELFNRLIAMGDQMWECW